MANWTLVGELGSGKSITAVGKMREYLESGLQLASNMDLFLDKLLPPMSRAYYIRLPDFPTAEDLWALGMACEEKDEKKYGGLFLDELAVFLNSREWQGKARDQVIKFLRHVRKRHWHTYFITQDIESLDAQARRALIEHRVSCKRTDRLSIPLVGWIIRALGLGSGYLPRSHWGIVRYGKDDRSPIVETWRYWGTGLHDAYNTDQVFTEAPYFDREAPFYFKHLRPLDTPVMVQHGTLTITHEQAGSYCVLSAWHTRGRYLSFYSRYKPVIKTGFVVLSLLFLVMFWLANHDELKPRPVVRPSTAEPFTNYLSTGSKLFITTKDGRILEADEMKTENNKLLIRVGPKWYIRS